MCSGIEAATVAWAPLGWQAVAFSEIDKFPSAVLAQHYPTVPNYGDLTRFQEWPDAAVDLLVGGTPCQSFSVAGLRKGMADPRGNLALTYLALADRLRPRWLVWENVPGVLSSGSGRDFGAFLGALGQLGYGFAYRVLDAQYFGLAQRRKRVFVVGYLGDWRRAAAVLFERESLSGHPAPRREAGQGITAGTLRGADGGSDENDAEQSRLVAFGGNNTSGPIDLATACNAHSGSGRMDFESETLIAHALRADGFDASEDGTGRGTPIVPIDMRQASRGEKLTNKRTRGSGGAPGHGVGEAGDPAFTVSGRGQAVAFDARQSDVISYGDKSGPLDTDGHTIGIQTAMQVRRLTPRECERLQGFPDDYTLISYRSKPAADGPRYKALGNSMAVPVVRWIGRRIAAADALDLEQAA